MRRTKAEAEETRNSIICAAERTFYAKGVSQTTLEDVAHEAGVTRGAIYWHFANKTDLFLALYDSVPLPQEDMIGFGFDNNDVEALDLIEKTMTDWLVLISTDVQRQRMFSILLRCDYSDGLVPVLERQQEISDRHMRALTAAFVRADLNQQMDKAWTPESATRTLCWLIKGMCTEWLLFGQRFDLATEGRESVRRLMSGFRAGV